MFNLFKKSLLHQLVGYFSLLSIVSVVLVAVSANVRSREALKHSVIERLNVATAIKQSQLNQWIVNQRRDVIWLTQFPDFLVNSEIALMKDRESLESKASIDALRKFMANIPSIKPNLFQISILNNNGITIVSTDKQQEGKYQPLGNTTTYFTRDQSRIIIPNFYISPISGKAAMTFAAPLSNRSGTSIGVVAVDLNLQEVDDIIRLSSGLGTSSETYLVGRLTSENILLSGAVTDKKEIAKDIKSEGITAAALSKDGEGLYRNYKNEPVLGSFLWIDNLNLILMAEISQSEAFEPANRLARDILLIGFSSAGILLTAVYVIARRISQPILAIADAANQVSAGNLNSQAPVLTEDEIGVLAIAFNQMTAQLKSDGEQLLDYSHTLEQKVEQRTHELNQAKEQAEEANKLISALLDKISAHENGQIDFVRIRASLKTHKKGFTEQHYNLPHVDYHFPHKSVVYYVNESDGDTWMFNEEFKQFPEPDIFTVKQRITPKPNRLIIFDGLCYHTASNPINNDSRMIININYVDKKLL